MEESTPLLAVAAVAVVTVEANKAAWVKEIVAVDCMETVILGTVATRDWVGAGEADVSSHLEDRGAMVEGALQAAEVVGLEGVEGYLALVAWGV